MAYRRKGGTARPTISEDFGSGVVEAQSAVGTAPPSSIAARAIRDSSAHGDSSLSSVYGQSAIASANRESNRQKVGSSGQDSTSYEYTSMNSLTESKNGFWGALARKAKAFLEDEPVVQKFETYEREHPKMVDKKSVRQNNQSQQQPQIYSKMEVPPQKSSDSISSSLTYIGGTIKNALGEGLTIMENKTVDIIQETKKLHIRKKGGSQTEQNQALNKTSPKSFPQIQADYETQLKASRDVANAMAAKAKLLMREMKTVKADLAFAKERCTQLEGVDGDDDSGNVSRCPLQSSYVSGGILAGILLFLPYLRMHWWRVCLDVAQMVECNTASVTEMAIRLHAHHCWCITGTPIQHRLDDLFGLLRFLRACPFDVHRWWVQVCRDPYEVLRHPSELEITLGVIRSYSKAILGRQGYALAGRHLLLFEAV